MSSFNIEDQIQKAQQNGQFDHLRGQGKPFTHLDTDAFEQLVKEQGFRPHFVELDHEIRAKTEIARQAVRRTYEWVMQARGGGSVDRHYAHDEWHKALRIFDQRLAEINQLIKTFNLELPEALRQSQKFSLKRDEELQKLNLTMKLD
ncbi:MAG TPA: DnaJ family domain-containing protein [Anaerolineae bacterium]|nr:DnaJ family domain-containing protein [Anaerolineae bacterium]